MPFLSEIGYIFRLFGLGYNNVLLRTFQGETPGGKGKKKTRKNRTDDHEQQADSCVISVCLAAISESRTGSAFTSVLGRHGVPYGVTLNHIYSCRDYRTSEGLNLGVYFESQLGKSPTLV